MRKNLLFKFRQIGLIMFLTSVSIFTFGQEYHFQYGLDSIPAGWSHVGVFFSTKNINSEWSGNYGGTVSAKIDPGEWMMTSKYHTAGTLSFWLKVTDTGTVGDVFVELGVVGSTGDTTWTNIWAIGTAEAYPEISLDGGSPFFKQHSVDINNSTDSVIVRFNVDAAGLRKIYFDDIALTKMEPSSVNDFVSVLDVHFGPNPARGYVNVKMDESVSGKITLYNLNGQSVKNTILNGRSDIKVDVSDLSKGIYILSVEAGKKAYRSKLIVE